METMLPIVTAKKVQTFNLNLPAGTAATRREFRCQLDSEYDNCTGFYAIENRNGGLTTPWKIGIKDDSRTYLDLTNGKHLQASLNYEIKKRFYPAQIRAKGRVLIVTIETFEGIALGNSLDIDFIVEVEKIPETAKK